MSNPIDTAAKGLVQSQTQLANSAKRLVQSATPTQRPSFDSVTQGQNASAFVKQEQPSETRRPTASAPSSGYSGAPLQGQGAYIPSLAEETVQMRMAANAYKANAKLMTAADDILKMTQDVLAERDDENEPEGKA